MQGGSKQAPGLLRRVRETIREYRMIAPGDRVAVACSGGADSVAMLLILRELSDELGCVLTVAHLNHRLRGGESDADEAFVRELAAKLEYPFICEHADVGRQAREARTNLEAMARKLRYEFFRELMETGKADRVAVAQTADDQAETVLFRVLRGAGTRGMAGIYPVLDGRVIRPLLDGRRGDLRVFLEERDQSWREDSSNRDLRLTRNRIRHELLPALLPYNRRLVETLCHTAEIAREDEAFWREYLEPMIAAMVRVEGSSVRVDLERFQQVPRAAGYRILRWAVSLCGTLAEGNSDAAPGTRMPVDFSQIRQLFEMATTGQSGHSLSLPGGIRARRQFDQLLLEARPGGPGSPTGAYSYPVKVPGSTTVPEIGATISFELIPWETDQQGYNEKETILLDRSLVGSPLTLRNWHAGDGYQQAGHEKPRKLKEFFQRNRVPGDQRAAWPVLVQGDSLVWARGMAVAEGFGPVAGSREAIRLSIVSEVPEDSPEDSEDQE